MSKIADLLIFRDYSISELAEKLGYSEAYVLGMKLGSNPIREIFRLRAAKALARPESELFAQVRTELEAPVDGGAAVGQGSES